MTTLVVGASGATGRQLVNQLLDCGQNVKVIVRSPERVPQSWKNNNRLCIVHASVLELTDFEMAECVKGCQAIASCLGHTLSWKGVYGQPRRLVTDTVQRCCNAISANAPEEPIKYVLMNTTGNRNRDLNERISFGQKCIIGLIRLLLPPHADNETAADYLREKIGQSNQFVQWVAVRPDSLVDEEKVTNYEVYSSPIKSAIFDSGRTSRINVGHFMANLIRDESLWEKWKGQMPVIYNTVSSN
jgi:nucleoside-diphosphate-sugar epimerase